MRPLIFTAAGLEPLARVTLYLTGNEKRNVTNKRFFFPAPRSG